MMLCLTNDIRIWMTTSGKLSTKVLKATLDSDFHAFVSYFGSSFVFPMDLVILFIIFNIIIIIIIIIIIFIQLSYICHVSFYACYTDANFAILSVQQLKRNHPETYWSVYSVVGKPVYYALPLVICHMFFKC